MFHCLKCQDSLARVAIVQGVYWNCAKCHSRFVGLGLLRKIVEERHVTALWMAATKLAPEQARPCPSCHRSMATVYFNDASGRMELDVCKVCYMVWFDPEEFERLPIVHPMQKPHDPIPQEFKLQYARTLVGMMSEAERERKEQWSGPLSDLEAWQMIPAFLGLPVKTSADPALRVVPWGTLACVAVNSYVAMRTLPRIHELADQWGFLPSDPAREHGLTFLSSSFMHANLWHLIANMYFLLIFGGNVEELLGTGRFLALYLGGAVAGCVSILLLSPDASVPTIGASTSVFAVATYFMLAFPRARIGFALFARFSYRAYALKIPAIYYLFGLLLLQLVGLLLHLRAISYAGHLGGILCGLGYWIYRDLRKIKEPLLLSR